MAFWSWLLGGERLKTTEVLNAPTFDGTVVDSTSIPAQIFGFTSYEDPQTPVAPINRSAAIQVPAVKKGRDLIAGTIASIPFHVIDGDNVELVSNLLEQPESSLARSVTMAKTVEDLLFEAVAYWWVRERTWNGWPVKITRLETAMTQIDERGHAKVVINNKPVDIPPKDLIVFTSPTEGVLTAGARAIRTYLKLSAAADRYADSPMPQGWFTPKPESDPDEDDVQTALDEWDAARRSRATGYVNAALDYHTAQWSPEQLQMGDARQHAVLEIARVFGLDAEDLDVSTTSRTYQNSQDRRIAKINDVLGMYIEAIEDRLSMPDVTPRGHKVKADFNGFLRADDKTRFETYQLGVELGIYDRNAIAAREGLPQPTFPVPSEVTPAVVSGTRSPASAGVRNTLGRLPQAGQAPGPNFEADGKFFGFDTDETRNTFQVDPESRTIAGLAVPYGVPARKNGRIFQFSQGSLTWNQVSRVKLLIQHDRSQAVGKAVELEDRPEGLFCKFKVARGPEGDKALALAEDGVYDGLSIGLTESAQFSNNDGIFHARPGNLLAEISLTPNPAFDEARVSAVVAEADHERTDMTDSVESTTSVPQFDMDALVAKLSEKLQGPQVVNHAESTATFEVNEPAPYVFDSRGVLHRGAFDFASDLSAGLQRHDREAYDRAFSFIQAELTPQFETDVKTTDVDEANPNRQRPDLFVDQRRYQYPMWSAVVKETLTEVTPLVLPKYNSSATLVSAHTEGTEPSAGTFTLTGQTVTPSALSGRVAITREVWDAVGNPAVSNIIWGAMVRAWFENLESSVVTALNSSAAASTTITTAASGSSLSGEISAVFAGLQYQRGGFMYDNLALQIDLFKKLVAANDTTGRPLFPIRNPSNAPGSSQPRYQSIDVHGVTGYPGPFTTASASTASNSYLFEAASVFGAASAPQRLDFQYRVAEVDLAIWGYKAIAVIDVSGVYKLVYDPI